MDVAPPIGQRLGVEVGLPMKVKVEMVRYLTLRHVCLHFWTECKYSKNVKFYKVKADTHYRIYGPYMYEQCVSAFKLHMTG